MSRLSMITLSSHTIVNSINVSLKDPSTAKILHFFKIQFSSHNCNCLEMKPLYFTINLTEFFPSRNNGHFLDVTQNIYYLVM
jgi:hypothetical protein